MGFLDGLFENKATRKTTEVVLARDSISRAVAGGNQSYNIIGLNTQWDMDKAVSKAYERVIWVFRCVDAIASAAASVPINMKEYDTEQGHKIEDKVLNKLLNRKTN